MLAGVFYSTLDSINMQDEERRRQREREREKECDARRKRCASTYVVENSVVPLGDKKALLHSKDTGQLFGHRWTKQLFRLGTHL